MPVLTIAQLPPEILGREADFLRAADEDPAFAGEIPRFVAEIKQIFGRTEIGPYLDGVQRVGPLAHTASDEAYEEMREAGVIDKDPVEWIEEILSRSQTSAGAPDH